jgi:osmotically-inducible protein OsmY
MKITMAKVTWVLGLIATNSVMADVYMRSDVSSTRVNRSGVGEVSATYMAEPQNASRILVAPRTTVIPINSEQFRQDQYLTKSIQDSIYRNQNLSLGAQTIDIQSESGVVTLSGVVNNPDERAVVEGLVFGMPGVIRVESNLQVLNQ